MIPLPIDPGFAIQPLEEMFFETCSLLVGAAIKNIHFCYSRLGKGQPKWLNGREVNLFQFDLYNYSDRSLSDLKTYVAEHEIDLAICLDMQPSSPVFRSMREGGVKRIVSYWGAPISSRMPWWKRKLKSLLLSLDRDKADLLIFESHAMEDLAVNGRGVSRDSIRVIPLGIDTNLFQPVPYQLNQQTYAHEVLGISPEKKIVFYAGHFEPRKGVSVLIDAAMSIFESNADPDLHFAFFGNRPGERQDLIERISSSPYSDSIKFYGYRNDIPKILPNCLCGVIPSIGWDSFPRTALEIQASGVPFIGSRLQGIPETTKEGISGFLFTPGNHHELASYILRLASDPELRKSMGNKARTVCEENFTLALQYERFHNVLSDLFKDRISTSPKVDAKVLPAGNL
jgi:glycosyltransferase involved in cell wall biosynthesis